MLTPGEASELSMGIGVALLYEDRMDPNTVKALKRSRELASLLESDAWADDPEWEDGDD